MVVGFHHKKGSLVEYVHPPLPSPPSQPDQIGITLPLAWKDLPSLALPDGAHKYENDIVFFHLPSTDEPKRTIFAVSCLMQVESSHYKPKDDAVTRSSVLKSLCVLSSVPLFGLISSKVALATQVWFRQEDFSDVDLLKDLYKSLTVAVPSPVCPDISVLSIDLDLQKSVTKFGKSLIHFFKVLLLEPKLMFLIEPTADMSRLILGFLSLYPGMLEKGLLLSGISPHLAPPNTPAVNSRFSFSSTTSATTEEQQVDNSRKSDSEYDIIENSAVPPSIQSSIDLISSSLVSDSNGFPLAIFGPENACLPYVSVSFLERLPQLNSYLIGCTNILYLHKCEYDAVVQCDYGNSNNSNSSIQQQQLLPLDRSNAKLKVTFKNRFLKKIVKPTPSDKRFISWILKTIEADTKSADPYFAGSNWVASDEWIREQFRLYLLGLFSSVAHNNEKVQEAYGTTFVAAWRRKLNHSVWLRGINRDSYPNHVHPGDDPSAAGNFSASSSIFSSTGMPNLSGASALATATAAQISSKAAVVSASAKKFLFSKAGGFVSSVFGGPNQQQTSKTSNDQNRTQGQASSSSSSARQTPTLDVERIDDRGGDSTSNSVGNNDGNNKKAVEEAESQF